MCMFYKSSIFSLFGLVILNLSSSQSSSSSVFICLEAIHLVKASLLSVTFQCSLSHHQSNTLCYTVLHTQCYTVFHCVTLQCSLSHHQSNTLPKCTVSVHYDVSCALSQCTMMYHCALRQCPVQLCIEKGLICVIFRPGLAPPSISPDSTVIYLLQYISPQ